MKKSIRVFFSFIYIITMILGREAFAYAMNSSYEDIRTKEISNIVPVIDGCENKTIKVSEVETFDKLKGITAKDSQGVDITDKIKVSGEIGKPAAGTNERYELIYEVYDMKNNFVKVKREIIVTNQLPQINGISSLVVKQNEKIDWMYGVEAIDKEDGNITNKIHFTTVNTFIPGEYESVYTITDTDGNTINSIRKIIVEENSKDINESPVILADEVVIKVGCVFNPLEKVRAEDKEDGDISDKITVEKNNVDINKVGIYYVTYRVIDSQGKITVKTIRVNVEENFDFLITEIYNSNKDVIIINESFKENIISDKTEGQKSEDKNSKLDYLGVLLIFVCILLLIILIRKRLKQDT